MSKTTMADWLHLLRVSQWLKNLMLFFPPFLGGALFNANTAAKGLLPFIAFCFVSSSMYVLNDILDASRDANHLAKKSRPVAAGKVSKHVASVFGVVLACVGLALSWWASSSAFVLILCGYLVVTSWYSCKLKEYPLVDIFCISSGFLLRLEAGGVVFDIVISEWLFLSVFLLALFLSAGKRLSEKNVLREVAEHHRPSLGRYPQGFLEGTMFFSGAAVLVTYTMYVISRKGLLLTVPLCTFGLLRYMLRVQEGRGGDPTESLLKDLPLFIVGVAWVAMVGWAIYLGR